MAQSSQLLGYVCRSCRQTQLSRHIRPNQQIRGFSRTSEHQKTLATFTQTNEPDLDTLLAEWRKKTFLPSILPPHHQDLLYKNKHREVLTTPPGVTVSVQPTYPPSHPKESRIEEERIKLEPAQRFDKPAVVKSLAQIAKAFQNDHSAATWDNLIPFLEGMRQARIQLPAGWLEQLARYANASDNERWTTLLVAAAMVKRTGLTLSMQMLTRELVTGAFQRGCASNFADEEPARTMRRILIELEKEEHHAGRFDEDAKKVVRDRNAQYTYADMRANPLVLAVKLAFRSAKVLIDSRGKDVESAVASDIQKLLAIDFASAVEKGHVGGVRPVAGEKHMASERRSQLQDLAILYGSVSLASRVDLQPSLGKEENIRTSLKVQQLLEKVKHKVQSVKEQVEADQGNQTRERRCFMVLEDVERMLEEV